MTERIGMTEEAPNQEDEVRLKTPRTIQAEQARAKEEEIAALAKNIVDEEERANLKGEVIEPKSPKETVVAAAVEAERLARRRREEETALAETARENIDKCRKEIREYKEKVAERMTGAKGIQTLLTPNNPAGNEFTAEIEKTRTTAKALREQKFVFFRKKREAEAESAASGLCWDLTQGLTDMKMELGRIKNSMTGFAAELGQRTLIDDYDNNARSLVSETLDPTDITRSNRHSGKPRQIIITDPELAKPLERERLTLIEELNEIKFPPYDFTQLEETIDSYLASLK